MIPKVYRTVWNGTDDELLVKSFSAVCLLTAMYLADVLGSNHVIGLIAAYQGASHIEKWMPQQSLEACNVERQESNSELWQPFVEPYLKHTIKGVWWYQGMTFNISYRCVRLCLAQERLM